MIEANKAFFNNICFALEDAELISRVSSSKRYIQTNTDEKIWLRKLEIISNFHFARDTHAH